jgi:hypothetical protein
MLERDLLVAGVAVGLGCHMILAAVQDNEWCFQLHSARSLERSIGRTPARIVIGLVGTLVILMGVYIIFTPLAGKFIRSKPNESAHPNLTSMFQQFITSGRQ